jgi:archaetidylinositol phosphate synthase
MADFIKEKRINDILLGPIERPVLSWLAAHTPAWITPDKLTAFGFFASVLIFVSYWLTNINPAFLWLASFAILLNWLGDSLDGNLARYRKIERPKYGFFIDHTVDALNEVLIFLGIGLSRYVDFRLACLALIGYLLLSILIFIKTYVDGVFRISWARLGPTEMRLIAILTNAVVFFIGDPQITLPFGRWSLYNCIVLLITCILYIGYVVILIQQARQLSSIDKVKGNPSPSSGRLKQNTRKSRIKVNEINLKSPDKSQGGFTK